MKCKNCGAELGLEDAFCRYCGAPNEFAQKHIKDMTEFKQSYEQTEKSVHKTTKVFAGTSIRVVILSILIVITLLGVFLLKNTYMWETTYQNFIRAKNQKEISATLDSYLENGDYANFASLCSYYRIYSYTDGSYEKYSNVINMTERYQYIINDIRRIITPNEYSSMFVRYENLADDVSYFFSDRYIDPDATKLLKGEAEYLADMEENIKAALITYIGLTQEEADSLAALDEPARKQLIEGKYHGTVD